MFEATKKVSGGKLLRVVIEGKNKIEKISITGDFFLHPEEALTRIEKSLCGLPFDTSIEDYAENIAEMVYQTEANFVGVSEQNIAETIWEAVHTPEVWNSKSQISSKFQPWVLFVIWCLEIGAFWGTMSFQFLI